MRAFFELSGAKIRAGAIQWPRLPAGQHRPDAGLPSWAPKGRIRRRVVRYSGAGAGAAVDVSSIGRDILLETAPPGRGSGFNVNERCHAFFAPQRLRFLPAQILARAISITRDAGRRASYTVAQSPKPAQDRG